MIKFILLLFLTVALSAKYLTFQEVHSMPKGVEKNYYIWRYINQKSTTKADAMRIIKEASRVNYLLKKAYKKKTGLNPPKVSGGGFYVSSGPSRPKPPNKELAKKRALTKQILSSPNPLMSWLSQPPAMQLFIFNNGGKTGRKKLDYTPTPSHWKELTKSWRVNKTIKYLRKESLPKFKKALYMFPASDNKINYSNLMAIGFLNLHQNKKLAESAFAQASTKARTIEQADRALFWAWKVGKKRKYLTKLANSYSINIYSLAGRDILGMKYDLGITPKLPKGKLKHFNIKNPVEWSRLKRKIFSKKTNLYALADKFKVEEGIGIYSYIMSRASKDRAQYFPMPYREYLSRLPIKRQAIIYAIARQESKFVPSAVSGSFALGMMQIMPFLVRHLAMQKKELIDYDDMFNPYKALDYANTHLDYLTKWLHHPLFVAYAYNAGIGYTRKLITRGDYFHSDENYEPWLSLERITNYQANDYGKKVLANYVIYLNKLGYHIRLTDLVNSLTNKKITDEFRRRKK